MSETVTLTGYDWTGMLIVLVVVAAMVVFAWYIDHIGNLEWIGGVIATSLGILVLIATAGFHTNASDNHDHDQRVAAVHNLGYSDITVDGDKFTASDDGIYKSGAFVQVDGDQWIILEGK